MLYQAKAAGAEVRKIVSSNPSDFFSVHKQFEDGFTVINDQKMIYIGNEKKGILPFGIHLKDSDYRKISQQKNNKCQFERNGDFLYLIDRSFEVEVTAEILYYGLNQRNKIRPDSLKQKIYQLTKFEKTISIGFELERKDSVPAFKKLFSSNRSELAKGLLYYLGRGSGVFPAGDCFLIGLMAVDQLFPIFSRDFYQLLIAFLGDKKWTTVIANAYLEYAGKKQFSSSINSVIAGLIEPEVNWHGKINELRSIGSRPAGDILAGIIAGANIYLEKLETIEYNKS